MTNLSVTDLLQVFEILRSHPNSIEEDFAWCNLSDISCGSLHLIPVLLQGIEDNSSQVRSFSYLALARVNFEEMHFKKVLSRIPHENEEEVLACFLEFAASCYFKGIKDVEILLKSAYTQIRNQGNISANTRIFLWLVENFSFARKWIARGKKSLERQP